VVFEVFEFVDEEWFCFLWVDVFDDSVYGL